MGGELNGLRGGVLLVGVTEVEGSLEGLGRGDPLESSHIVGVLVFLLEDGEIIVGVAAGASVVRTLEGLLGCDELAALASLELGHVLLGLLGRRGSLLGGVRSGRLVSRAGRVGEASRVGRGRVGHDRVVAAERVVAGERVVAAERAVRGAGRVQGRRRHIL